MEEKPSQGKCCIHKNWKYINKVEVVNFHIQCSAKVSWQSVSSLDWLDDGSSILARIETTNLLLHGTVLNVWTPNILQGSVVQKADYTNLQLTTTQGLSFPHQESLNNLILCKKETKNITEKSKQRILCEPLWSVNKLKEKFPLNYSAFHKSFDRRFAQFVVNFISSLRPWEFHYVTVNQMATFETNLRISRQTSWECTLNTRHKNALSAQAAKYWKNIFSFLRVSDSCGIMLNFLKEYKPRSCVMLRLIDACDRTFLGKHWNVYILFQFVLDFTAVNAGVSSFTTLHIIIHIIQHALTKWYFFICCLQYSLCEQKYQPFWQWFLWEVSVPVLF